MFLMWFSGVLYTYARLSDIRFSLSDETINTSQD